MFEDIPRCAHADRTRSWLSTATGRGVGRDAMDKQSFVCSTYIKTTPELLWRALTRRELTERYWGVTFDSDWTAGSTFVWHEGGIAIADRDQVVLEALPGRRLSYTWHTFTPEWGKFVGGPACLPAEYLDSAASEARSKVTFDIENFGVWVKLTVTHDGFDPGSVVLESVSQGWPMLLANLKTMLETGEVMSSPKAARAALELLADATVEQSSRRPADASPGGPTGEASG